MVSKNVNTKFESKSQLCNNKWKKYNVGIKERKYKVWKQITTILKDIKKTEKLVSKNVNTKFESKSQLIDSNTATSEVGIKERKYKVWKQITTISLSAYAIPELVSKNVNTKFESKSQPAYKAMCESPVGIKERKYKVWKQITTDGQLEWEWDMLVSKNVNTKFESKSQHYY